MSFRPNIKSATIDGDRVKIVGRSPNNPRHQLAISVTLEQGARKATGHVVAGFGEIWQTQIPVTDPAGGPDFTVGDGAKASGTETRDGRDGDPFVTINWSQEIDIVAATANTKS